MKIVNYEYLDFQQAMEAIFWSINSTCPENEIHTLFGIIELRSLYSDKSFIVRRSHPNYKMHPKRVETDFFRAFYRPLKSGYASDIASLTIRVACNILTSYLTDDGDNKKTDGEFFAYVLNNYSMLPFARDFRRHTKDDIIEYLYKDSQRIVDERGEILYNDYDYDYDYDYQDFEDKLYELYDKFDYQIVQAIELYERSLKTIGYKLDTEFQILFGYLMNTYEISSENLENLMNDIKKIHERTSTINVVTLLKQIMTLAKYKKYI